MAFDKAYYLGKQKKLEEKIQKLNNDTFTGYLQIGSNYFNQNAEIQAELKEIEEQLKEVK